jgi:protein-tyrosine-phosphatase
MVNVLFICTGNLCRSPSAAWLFKQRVQEFGPKAVTVESAGTRATSSPTPRYLQEEGAQYGLDLSTHQPRRMDAEMISRAHLIVGMAREHVREIVLADTPAFSRTFTLREIVRKGQEKGSRSEDEPIGEWLERLSLGRRHMDLIGDSATDDTPDPMGGSAEEFRRMLAEVSQYTEMLHTLLWPRVRQTGQTEEH